MDRPSANSRYPIPARLNLLIVGVQLLAAMAIFIGAALATSWWQVGVLALGFAVVGNSIYAIIHEAEHGLLHPNKTVNAIVGMLMALLFPAPFHLIRQGHIGHHLRNRSDDEAFDLYFDGDSRFLSWLQLYGILTGLYYWTVVASNVAVLLTPWVFTGRAVRFDRSSAALMESLNPRYWTLIRLEAVAAIALHVGIVVGLGVPVLYYLAIYCGFGFSWSAMQYVHHFATERDVIDGTRNLRLWGPIDCIWLNHNQHLAHHRHPTVPWVYLPDLDRDASPEMPVPEALLLHYFRMWRGPRYSDEHVENRHAGRIIR